MPNEWNMSIQLDPFPKRFRYFSIVRDVKKNSKIETMIAVGATQLYQERFVSYYTL